MTAKRRCAGVNACRVMSIGLVTLCVLAGDSVLASVPAFAEKVYYPGISIGEPCGTTCGEGQFKEPVGVAVDDATNDIYVVDKGNNRVEYFSATGDFIGQFNGSATPAKDFSAPEQIAIDNSGNPMDHSTGDVYVVDTGNNAIDEFSSTGAYEGQLTGASCKERKGKEALGAPLCKAEEEFLKFKRLRNVTVDASGNLWVYGGFDEEGGYILEFSPEGAFLNEFSTERFSYENIALAVDSKTDIYIGVATGNRIVKFSERGNEIEAFPEGANGEGATALAVVPSTSSQLANDLLVDKGGNVVSYGPFGEPYNNPLGSFPEIVPKSFAGFSGSFGLAVNAEAVVYASETGADRVQSFDYVSVPVVTTEVPTEVTETSLVLHGSVNPEGEEVNECFFEYRTEVGETEVGKTISCELGPGQKLGGENKLVPVSADLSNLQPVEVRSFRLVVVTGRDVEKGGRNLVVSRPMISGEAVSEVGSSTAKLNAVINAGGLNTCYGFKYCTGEARSSKCIAAGGEGVMVSVEVNGLQPAKGCNFKVVARNALGEMSGASFMFSTFAPSAALPPDGRVVEAVSPVGAGANTEVYVPAGMKGELDFNGRHGIYTNRPFEVAADGETVTYVGDPPASGGNGNDGLGGGNQYMAKRSMGGGWTQVSVNASVYENHYVAFSEDLSAGVLGSPEVLAEDAPESITDLYKRSVGWSASVREGLEGLEPLLGAFEPLIAATPCTSPKDFGSIVNNTLFEPLFAGGNGGSGGVAVFSHLLLEADAALPSTPPAPGCEAANNLYDWVGGQLYLVNVLPGGEVKGSATFGRQGPSKDGFLSPEVSGVVSGNGSRIYWSAVKVEPVGGEFEEQPQALYVRENDTQPESEMENGRCTEPTMACTVQVDASTLPGEGKEKEEKGGHGQFWAASGDGSRVFFTDELPLMEESVAGPGASDLYEYDLEAPEGKRLSDLSLPVKPKAGDRADVLGVVGVSSDGSYAYFVAGGVLTEGKNAEGGEPVEGQPNLYVRHGGVTKFIATLSGGDGDLTGGEGGFDGDWQADAGHRTAEVTPDGRSVVFMSRLPLTGYENRVDGVGLTEVFVYDAESGRLVCASCNPSGEAPVAPTLPEFVSSKNDLEKVWGSFLPVSDSLTDYQPRVISDDGSRVFFDSIEPLVPQDDNGFADVYEWERERSGSCHEAQSSETGGCVFLLSGGQSTDNSYLIDASASGGDVFFVSRAHLVRADHGDSDVLYDARVGGVEPPTEGGCSGAGCQGAPPAPPIFSTPASVTFEGNGNNPLPEALACKKGLVEKNGKCVEKVVKRKKRRAGKNKTRVAKRKRAVRGMRVAGLGRGGRGVR
jgi:NHL repeat